MQLSNSGSRSRFQSHHSITKGMYDRFKKYLNKWLKENGTTSSESVNEWFLGESINNPNVKTTCTKDCSLKRPPFHAIYKYKTQKIANVNTASNSSSSTTTTTATTSSSSLATVTTTTTTTSLSNNFKPKLKRSPSSSNENNNEDEKLTLKQDDLAKNV